jgi:S1-C subfamily serine protease
LARRVALQLIETGYHIKPSIGIQLGQVEDRNQYYKLIELDVPSFLEIKEVVEGSPAERFGLLHGDILISIDGVKVESSPDVIEFLWGKMPGDVVVFEVWRTNNNKGQLQYINLTLDALEPSSELFGN